jgi:hypothetical protein
MEQLAGKESFLDPEKGKLFTRREKLFTPRERKAYRKNNIWDRSQVATCSGVLRWHLKMAS